MFAQTYTKCLISARQTIYVSIKYHLVTSYAQNRSNYKKVLLIRKTVYPEKIKHETLRTGFYKKIFGYIFIVDGLRIEQRLPWNEIV